MLEVMEKVEGKWNKNSYIVLSKIGRGGIGTVYKVRDSNGKIMALKISTDINSITREYNMMNNLKNIENIPKVYEIDDYKKNGNTYYFIVMDYVEGYSIKEIIKYRKLNLRDILGIGIALLIILEKIYKMNYIYADIKPDNILIDTKNRAISFIDFGGVIEKGQGIREFTPAYNILSWGIKESNSYERDIVFSVSMLITAMLLKREFNPLVDNLNQIIQRIKLLKIDNGLKKCLINGLLGKVNDISIFQYKLKRFINSSDLSCSIKNMYSMKIRTNKKIGLFVDAFFIFSIIFFVITMILGLNLYF